MVQKTTKANGHIVQADWLQTDPSKMDYIHNKPEIPNMDMETIATKEYVENKACLHNSGTYISDYGGYIDYTPMFHTVLSAPNNSLIEIFGSCGFFYDEIGAGNSQGTWWNASSDHKIEILKGAEGQYSVMVYNAKASVGTPPIQNGMICIANISGSDFEKFYFLTPIAQSGGYRISPVQFELL